MKRIHLTLILATVLCVAGNAALANAGPVGTLEFNLGYAKTSNEFGIDVDDAPGGGLAFGAGYWRGISPQVSWGVEASYDNLGSVDYLYDDGFIVSDVTVSAHTLRVNPALRVNFGSMVGPNFFAQTGAGYYSVGVKAEMLGVEDSASDGNFGFNLGAGVGFPVGPTTRMNIQGQYHSVATEGESLNYLAFRAGIGIGL